MTRSFKQGFKSYFYCRWRWPSCCLLPSGHTRVPKRRRRTSSTLQLRQAHSRLWLQLFRPPVLWIL